MAGVLYVARRKKTILNAFDKVVFAIASLSSFSFDPDFRKQNWKRKLRLSPLGQSLWDLPPMFFRAVYHPGQ